jgi:thymidylate kinase
MIIEFVGSTGAGKTTLASDVQRRLAEQAQVVTSFELVADLLGLRRVTHPTARNLIQDLVGLPFFVGSLYRHRAFAVFALRTLARHRSHTFFTVNYLRSIVRKIGTYEIIKRYNHDGIILVDEGTLLSAHLLFVYAHTTYSQEDIEKFASLVPLPELVVYVKAPVESLVRRSLQRNDARKEMRSKNQMLIEKYVSRATEMFDRLTKTKRIRDRVLIVANPASTDDERGVVADRIATFILNYEPSGEQISTMPAARIEPASVIGEMRVS